MLDSWLLCAANTKERDRIPCICTYVFICMYTYVCLCVCMKLNTHKRAQKPQTHDLIGKHSLPYLRLFSSRAVCEEAPSPEAAGGTRSSRACAASARDCTRKKRSGRIGESMGRETHRSKEAARRAAACKSWLWCIVMTPNRLHATRASHRPSLLHLGPLSAAQRTCT